MERSLRIQMSCGGVRRTAVYSAFRAQAVLLQLRFTIRDHWQFFLTEHKASNVFSVFEERLEICFEKKVLQATFV